MITNFKLNRFFRFFRTINRFARKLSRLNRRYDFDGLLQWLAILFLSYYLVKFANIELALVRAVFPRGLPPGTL